ncbi:MazG family protein [Cerasicoccus maritimus]|uniref:MazG family protein n=1 Tax=Cerasicoccus maritimus TaxID=490089 RepID=UPI0028526A8F|nr:MazG family protein [Cerasicoccus maritimus]
MASIDDLRYTVSRLRGPGGCPWDIEQTHQTLCDCLVEECAELLDTIDRLDYEHMQEELGDVLLQVIMHTQMAEEEGRFSFDDVARDINEKLVRRHPHVFGDLDLKDSEAVLQKWEEIKAEEKKNGLRPLEEGPFKHLPPQLPALRYALNVFKQIEKKDLPVEGEYSTAAVDELADGLTEAHAGRALFELAAACRKAGIDPESALRRHASETQRAIAERVSEAEQSPAG